MERKITGCVERETTFIKCPFKMKGKKKENKKYKPYTRTHAARSRPITQSQDPVTLRCH